MNTIHDLGGMDGFTIPQRDQGRILKQEWERQIWGLRFAVRGTPGYLSGGRAAIENIPPEIYLNTPYYALRMYRLEEELIASGFVTEAMVLRCLPSGSKTWMRSFMKSAT